MALCDACGEPITNPGMAAVVFEMLTQTRDRAPEFAHKGGCHDALADGIRARGGFAGWEEFDRWIVNLAHNAGLHDEKLQATLADAELWYEMGL
jgi:hypothetical protein